MSRVKLTQNPAYSTVMTFYNAVEKPINIFSELGVKKYLKVYIMMLKSGYRHKGLLKAMLKAAEAMSAVANVPAISGIFTSQRSQQTADDLGYRKLNEILYEKYLIEDEVVFWDTGVGNNGAALMAYRIPNVVEPEEMHAQLSSRFALQVGSEDIVQDEPTTEKTLQET